MIWTSAMKELNGSPVGKRKFMFINKSTRFNPFQTNIPFLYYIPPENILKPEVF